MIDQDLFDVLFLLARPAAGKSEIIHYLEGMDAGSRARHLYIGSLDEIDDFPMLWTWFEEDDLLEKMGHTRLHTTPDGYFLGNHLWDLLIERISLEYDKRLRDRPSAAQITTLVEFSRGSEHGGYHSAFEHLSETMAARGAILYVDVSYQESLRKNRQRFNPSKPDSILEHGLSDEKLERLYRDIDWEDLTRGQPDYLPIRGKRVPYVVFENEDDVTTHPGPALAQRLEDKLQRLWELYQRR